MTDIPYLTDDELAGLGITTSEIMAAIETTLLAARDDQVMLAPKTNVIAPDGRYMMATLSASDNGGLIVVKSVMVNDANKAKGQPGINGAIMLLDSQSGRLKGIMDANWITAVRTAGLSAVAAKRLADPASESIGLIGAGVQAESHLRAFVDLFPLRKVHAFSRGAAGLEKIRKLADELGLAFESGEPKACLENSDIVVTTVPADYSIKPFLDARWLKPNAFASIVDLGIPWYPEGQTAFGQVYVDDLAQERLMDKPMVDPDLISGDLTDLAAEGATKHTSRPAAFVFRGIAAGDLAVAELAWRKRTL